MLFGRKKDDARTVLIIDVESGSVGSALLRISSQDAPKLFGEKRELLPVPVTLRGSALSHEVAAAAAHALHHAAEVASRIRLHPTLTDSGVVERVAIVLSPPWGRPNLAGGSPEFVDAMQKTLAHLVRSSVGEVPVAFYTSAGAAAYGTRALVGTEPILLCVIGGEVTELLRMDEQGVVAHATVPLGTHSLLRTLQSHGVMSEGESRSLLRLDYEGQAAKMREPFAAVQAHFGAHFADAARDIMQGSTVQNIYTVGEQSAAEWFARALAQEESVQELFPQGGAVRALRAHHFLPHLAAHAEVPDLRLSLAALFVDNNH